jgi:hypothetical protein
MSVYGYSTALEAAGANVIASESFGSYQGDWFAKVEFEGRTFWIHGSYGSCSGCDAFCAEFDFDGSDNGCEEHQYDKQENCAACAAHHEDYLRRLANFGIAYLQSGDMSQAEAEKAALEHWDDEDRTAMFEFIRSNAIIPLKYNTHSTAVN